MNARRAALFLASVAALFGSTIASADDGSSQVIRATVRAEGGLTVALRLAESRIPVGKETSATATVTNGTARTLVAVVLRLHVDEPGVTIHGGWLRVIPMLLPGQSRSATWSVCPRERGNYLLVITANALGRRHEEGLETAQSDTAILSVTAGRGRCNRRDD
ncbi:MAG: hypothetical protein C0506_11245 [Anaerolinea sp.]|nr:hypothetical protein [Anaerolinea sp.]